MRSQIRLVPTVEAKAFATSNHDERISKQIQDKQLTRFEEYGEKRSWPFLR
jgi:hypothetical protein